MASDFCIVLFRRRQKRQAVFGTAVRSQVGVHPFVLLIKYILPPKNDSFWQAGFLFLFYFFSFQKEKK